MKYASNSEIVVGTPVGLALKALRLNRGLTLKEFAKQLDTSSANISRWENGLNRPSNKFIQRINRRFDVEIPLHVSNAGFSKEQLSVLDYLMDQRRFTTDGKIKILRDLSEGVRLSAPMNDYFRMTEEERHQVMGIFLLMNVEY